MALPLARAAKGLIRRSNREVPYTTVRFRTIESFKVKAKLKGHSPEQELRSLLLEANKPFTPRGSGAPLLRASRPRTPKMVPSRVVLELGDAGPGGLTLSGQASSATG